MKLHAALAVTKGLATTWHEIAGETLKKFKAAESYFRGHDLRMQILDFDNNNEALEAAEAEHKELPTNVYDTLVFTLERWLALEDVEYAKEHANAKARGTIVLGQAPGKAWELPVGLLLGLEQRLTTVRDLFRAMPTLDATRVWSRAEENTWESEQELSIRTKKKVHSKIVAPATPEHPAQVQVWHEDSPYATMIKVIKSGAVTAKQKADAILRVDELLRQVRQARMAANEADAEPNRNFTAELMAHLLEPLCG